jgi:hypothetical protein
MLHWLRMVDVVDETLCFRTVGAVAEELVELLERDHDTRGVEARDDEWHPADNCERESVEKRPVSERITHVPAPIDLRFVEKFSALPPCANDNEVAKRAKMI